MIRNYTNDRLNSAIDSIDAELTPLIEERRNSAPNSTRAGIIADLSAERRIYASELRRRGENDC